MRSRNMTVKSLDTAIRIYYQCPEIGNSELRELFGNFSPSTFTNIRKEVKRAMDKKGVKSYVRGTVNTEIAYEVWGWDISDLERRRARLKKLNINTT